MIVYVYRMVENDCVQLNVFSPEKVFRVFYSDNRNVKKMPINNDSESCHIFEYEVA